MKRLYVSILLLFAGLLATAQTNSTATNKATYTLNTRPKGAKLYIDSQYVATTPCSFLISDGNHHFELSKNRYKTLQKDIVVKGITNNNLYFSLKKLKDSFTVPRFAVSLQTVYGRGIALSNEKSIGSNGGLQLEFSVFLSNHVAFNVGYLYNLAGDYHDESEQHNPDDMGTMPPHQHWYHDVSYNKIPITVTRYFGNVNKAYFSLDAGVSINHLRESDIRGDITISVPPLNANLLGGFAFGYNFLKIGYRQALSPIVIAQNTIRYGYGYFSLDIGRMFNSLNNTFKKEHQQITASLHTYPWIGYCRKYYTYTEHTRTSLFFSGIAAEFTMYLTSKRAISMGYMFNFRQEQDADNKIPILYSYRLGNQQKGQYVFEAGVLLNDQKYEYHKYNILFGLGWQKDWFKAGYRQSLATNSGARPFYGYGYVAFDLLKIRNIGISANMFRKKIKKNDYLFSLHVYPWLGYTNKAVTYDWYTIKKVLATYGLGVELTTFFTAHHAINVGYMLNVKRNQYSDDKIPIMYSYLHDTKIGKWSAEAGYLFNNGHNEGTTGNVLFGLGWQKKWLKAGYRQSLPTKYQMYVPRTFCGYGYVAVDVLQLVRKEKNTDNQ